MGLPLLTLAGQSFASRMAARMLHAIGADTGVTQTLEAYVSAAIALATDPDRYAAYRAHFTETAWTASLGDIDGFYPALRGRAAAHGQRAFASGWSQRAIAACRSLSRQE